MKENVVFLKEQVLSQFSTEELIVEVISRKNENLDRLIEAYLIAGVILKSKIRLGEETKQEIIEKLKGHSVD